MSMSRYFRNFACWCGVLAAAVAPAGPVLAAGDLLVAPTRVVINGGGSAQVILSNIGKQTATYRISLELRRMDGEGDLVDVSEDQANEREKAALALVRYSPRRITLPPNQPQSVRIVARAAPELPDGEYRVHMMFRGVPDPTEAAAPDQPGAANGLSIQLIPIYGITIPLIVRKGQLAATATIANPRIRREGDRAALVLDMTRSGERSVFGELVVRSRGGGAPLFQARGIAIYPEINQRRLEIQLSPEDVARLKGPLRFEYREPSETGGALIAAVDGTLG